MNYGAAEHSLSQTPPARAAADPARAHKYAQAGFAAALFVTLVAFWPSFFDKLRTTDAAHLIHGFSATAWMVIPAVQAWLIGRGRFALHRRVGRAALLLAPLVLVSALQMVQLMIVRWQQTQALRLLKFAFLDLGAAVLFVVFLALAVVSIRRGDVANHVRYMAGTVLFALEPAWERVFVFYVPGVAGFESALTYALFTTELILAALIWIDWRRRRRVAPAFVAALLFFEVMSIAVTPVALSPAFRDFVVWFAAL